MKMLALFLILGCVASCSHKSKTSNTPARQTAAFHKNLQDLNRNTASEKYNIAFVTGKSGKIICYSDVETVGKPDFIEEYSTLNSEAEKFLSGKNIDRCSSLGLDVARIVPRDAHLGELTVAIGPGAFFLIPPALCAASGFLLGKGTVKAIRKQKVGMLETPELMFGGITGVGGVGALMIAFLGVAPRVLDRPGFVPRLAMVSCGVPTGLGAVTGVVYAKFFD